MFAAIKNLDQFCLLIASAQSQRLGVVKKAASWWLKRPFSNQTCRKIAIVYIENYLAIQQFYLLAYHRKFLSGHHFEFRFFEYERYKNHKNINSSDGVILQSNKLEPNPDFFHDMKLFQKNLKNKNFLFFDWLAPTDLRFPVMGELGASGYFKKAILKSKEHYDQAGSGQTNLSFYFNNFFQLKTPIENWTNDPIALGHVECTPAFWAEPNIFAQIARTAEAPRIKGRSFDLHARIATKGTPWYQAMRDQAAAAVHGLSKSVLRTPTDLVGRQAYIRELRDSRMCFSPFGYGEMCWRDFESIISGSVLIKPDMSHIRCLGDLYRADETYVAVKWDLSDFEEKLGAALSDPKALQRMADAAFLSLKKAISSETALTFANTILNKLNIDS
jgi:hypothetical protein